MVCWRSVKFLCNCLDISFLLMVRNYWLRYQFGHEWPNTTRVSVFFLSSNKDFPGVWKMSAQIWWPTLSGNLGCHQNVSHQQISGHSRISGIRATGISPFQIFDLNQGCGHSSYGTVRPPYTTEHFTKQYCTTLYYTTPHYTTQHCSKLIRTKPDWSMCCLQSWVTNPGQKPLKFTKPWNWIGYSDEAAHN